MSSTAKDKIQAALNAIDHDMTVLTHADDREGYIKALRQSLMQHANASRNSKYTKHSSAVDGR